jgi:hypothetical protein
VITALVDEMKERGDQNKRLNLQAAVGPIARRTRALAVAVPPRGVRAVLHALFKAGELIHADGNPVRSPGASFVVPKSADALLLSLQSFYLRVILDKEPDDPDSAAMAELILGNRADAQDIEALIAWMLYDKASKDEPVPSTEDTTPHVPEDADDEETRVNAEPAADLETAPADPPPEEPAPEEPAKKKKTIRRPRKRTADAKEEAAD